MCTHPESLRTFTGPATGELREITSPLYSRTAQMRGYYRRLPFLNFSRRVRPVAEGDSPGRACRAPRARLRYTTPRRPLTPKEDAVPAFKNIIYEKRGRIACVTLNREERRNAIDPATSKELLDAFTDFQSDDEVWVAILTGAGDVAFSAGADLVAMAEAFAGGGQGPGLRASPSPVSPAASSAGSR